MGRGGGVLSFLFFAAELSSAFSFLIFVILADAGTHRIASTVARFWHFIIRVAVGFAFVVVCCGGVLSFLFFAAELSSAFSFLIFVILANAGTHRIASAVAWFWHFIASVGLALVVVCRGECVSKRGFWHVWMNGSPHARE
ncbi:TPA: hypothetical protein ACGU2D_003964 [Vibrio vulnificus]